MQFQDRVDAGRQLARKLIKYKEEKPIIIALPRGGVVVGYEVARALQAPLDVMVARKLGAPGQPELGVGAIAPNGVRVLNTELLHSMHVTEQELEHVTQQEIQEMERRLELYRGDKPMPILEGRTVIIVDDGLATGMTAKAAIRAVRQMRPKRIVLAIPVCSPQTAELIRPEVGALIYVEAPVDFMAVGNWYRKFDQVKDQEVLDLLEKARVEMVEPRRQSF